MSSVPYIFANQTGPIPLSELDANFANVKAFAVTANTVVGNNQANITQLGTLGSLSVAGNINSGNLRTTGITSVTGNITTASNVVATSNMYANTFFGNVNYGSGTVTGTGNLVGGNILISGGGVILGNLSVAGNVTYLNANTLTTNDLTITVGNNQSTGGALNGAGLLVGTSNIATWRFNNLTNSWQSNIAITPTSNATLSLGGVNNYWGAAYISSLNVTGNTVLGNLQTSGTGQISTGNITANNLSAGNVFATTSISAVGTVTGNNIVSTGNVVGALITTSGNVNSQAMSVTGTVTAASFVGSGSFLTGLAGNLTVSNSGNAINLVTPNYSIKEISGKLYFYYVNTQIASLDSAGNFTVKGNVTAFGTP
jgi:hypothetical protein